jgi:hypothetical protein
MKVLDSSFQQHAAIWKLKRKTVSLSLQKLLRALVVNKSVPICHGSIWTILLVCITHIGFKNVDKGKDAHNQAVPRGPEL